MSLFVKKITSIGAVDSGDNPESFIAFWKRKDVSAASADQTQGDGMSFDITALPDEAQTLIGDLQKSADESAQAIEALEAKIAELTPEAEVVEDVVSKASDEVQAVIAKQRDTIAEQAEALAVEVAKRRDTEFVAKVQEEELDVLLGKADEIGPVLRELSDAAPEAFDKIYPSLIAAAQRAGGFFKEIGAVDGESDPVSMRDAWVAKRKQEGSEKTDADLRNDFWDAHRDAIAAERDK